MQEPADILSPIISIAGSSVQQSVVYKSCTSSTDYAEQYMAMNLSTKDIPGSNLSGSSSVTYAAAAAEEEESVSSCILNSATECVTITAADILMLQRESQPMDCSVITTSANILTTSSTGNPDESPSNISATERLDDRTPGESCCFYTAPQCVTNQQLNESATGASAHASVTCQPAAVSTGSSCYEVSGVSQSPSVSCLESTPQSVAIVQRDVSVTCTSVSACAVNGCSTESNSQIVPDSVFGRHPDVLTAGKSVPVHADSYPAIGSTCKIADSELPVCQVPIETKRRERRKCNRGSGVRIRNEKL
jgi:hypothetical protein